MAKFGQFHPITQQPIVPVGFRKDGRAIWPILGGSEPVVGQPPASAPGQPATPPAVTPPAQPDKGFPEGTPLERMTGEQREAYWKHYARQHEERVRAFGGLTPEQLTELREKAKRADALDHELLSENEKKVADAKQAGAWEAEAALVPLLVDAELRAAAAGRIDPEKLKASLEFVDTEKFLTDEGQVDPAKVAAFIDGIAGPATGPGTTRAPVPARTGPTPYGQGQRPGSSAIPSVASGREEYARRHPKSSTPSRP